MMRGSLERFWNGCEIPGMILVGNYEVCNKIQKYFLITNHFYQRTKVNFNIKRDNELFKGSNFGNSSVCRKMKKLKILNIFFELFFVYPQSF